MSQVYLASTEALLIGETGNHINRNQIKCWFLVRRENQTTRGRTSQSKVENQQTQLENDVRSGNQTWATLVEGQCFHHCANTAP